jgi:hypothetical protein
MTCKCIPAHQEVCIKNPDIRPEYCQHKEVIPLTLEKVYDLSGNHIQVGSKVAYNMSGDVVIGYVMKIIPQEPRYTPDSMHYDPTDNYQFKVECASNLHWRLGEISFIRNKRGIHVIQ